MAEITVEQLNDFDKHTIFAYGHCSDDPKGVNITGSGGILKWVAVTGEVGDWAIYCHWADNTYVWIKDYGDKIVRREHIRKLVPCTDEALHKYRY